MTRRVNRSKKVPGVKLRPVRPEDTRKHGRPRTPSPSLLLSETQEDLETSFVDTCPRPFRGFTICTTGIDRSTIFPKAGEMGASTTAAFTDYVTHLIAEDHGGAKYWCAVERKIPILKPSWIIDTFERWQRGDDFDFDTKVEEHRLPTFSGITLCVSGIEDVDRRTAINRTVTQCGGKYVKNIERPVRVTHLLCSGNEETEKMHYARKFNERGEADIKLVWEEWFWDSLDFGGQFEDTPYLVTHPRPERRQLPPPSCPANVEVPDQSQRHAEPDPAAPEEEIAVARRVPAATLRVWESLLAPRGYSKVGSELIKTGPAEAPNSTPDPPPSLPKIDKGKGKARPLDLSDPPFSGKGRSALATFTRSKSFVPSTTPAPEDPSVSASRQPFRKVQSLFLPRPSSPAQVAPEPGGSSPKIFVGMRFQVRAEARSASVRSAIEGCGGTWVEDEDEEDRVDFVIVRLVSGSKLYIDEADPTLRPRYRTECWLEGCLSRGRICPFDEHPTFAPLPHTIHLPSITLSPSGLDLAEDMWVKRLARALGMAHAPTFNRATTHLLCPGAAGAKYARACAWDTPVVDMRWLSHVAKTGALPPPGMFLVPDSHVRDAAPSDVMNQAKLPELPQQGWTAASPQHPPLVHTPPPGATQRDADSAYKEMSFGRPKLLSSLDSVVPSSSPTSPPASSPPNDSDLPPSSLSAHPSLVLSSHSSEKVPVRGYDTDDEANARVPSSNTPSPLKLSSEETDPAARALHESISNLLGKRNAGAMAIEDLAEPPQRRKRARPRFKPDSTGTNAGASVSCINDPPANIHTTSYAFGDAPVKGASNMTAAPDDGMGTDLQAVYEDPTQAAERRKLISLLNGAPGQSRIREERAHRAAAVTGPSVPRGRRMAGF